MAKAIGIDLGTTNSASCWFDGKVARVLLNPHNEQLTPSVVCCEKFEDDEEPAFHIGRPAVNQARLFPKDTIYSIKRIIGRSFSDENVQRMIELVNYDIEETKEPVAGLAAVVMGGERYLPEDIAAMVLNEIKRYSETALGEPVTHAVVTVPAYFGEPERAATREAGRKAGLVVKTLLPEPTAAALAFGTESPSKDGCFVLVFDLGGGTFDVSILSVVEQDYNVMEVHGDHFLGGDDFDEEIVKLILRHVQEKHDADLSKDLRFRILAKHEAEKAKKALSGSDTVSIIIPEAARLEGKEINVKMRLTRDQFEERIQPYVDRCKMLVNEALSRQNLTPDDITYVLLVGGATAVPAVHRAIERMFGREKVRRDVNPMECVAIGAGILAAKMKGIECPACKTIADESLETCPNCNEPLSVARSALEGIAVTDITTNHFGVQAVHGSDPHAFRIAVPKGTEIPMRESGRITLVTTEDGQRLIRVPVFEGTGSSVLQNARIGVIEYDLPDGLPINHPVNISMHLDRQSIVTVTIDVEGFGWSKEQTLKRELTDETPDEEAPLIDEEEDEEDEAERMLAILETYLERGRRFLLEYDKILSDAQKRRLQNAIETAQEIFDAEQGAKAKEAAINIDHLLTRCGVASLLEQAQLAAHATDEATGKEILGAAEDIKRHAEARNQAMVQKLSMPLASMIKRVYRSQQEVERIGAADRFGGLLRDQQE